MRTSNIDDYDPFAYDDYPKETQTPMPSRHTTSFQRLIDVETTTCVYWVTPATPPILEAPPPGISTQVRGIKILPPKQLLQRLPILLAQVQGGNTSENLLNKIKQIVYSLYGAKQISKRYTVVYSNQYKDEYDNHELREWQCL